MAIGAIWADIWDESVWNTSIWLQASTSESAALSGDILALARENQLVAGSFTAVLTLTNTTWAADGAAFDAQRQAIIDGFTSDRDEAGGWNAAVRDALAVTAVTRVSGTVVEVAIPSTPGYDITAAETITVTVPASAIAGADPLVAGSFSIGLELTSGLGNVTFIPGRTTARGCARTPIETANGNSA